MVRILSNGDIVQDDDPRVRQRKEPSSRFGTIHSQDSGYGGSSGSGYQAGGGDAIPYHGGQQHYAEGPTLFDTWNQKLVQIGIPRWNIGSHTVEPLMTVMFLGVLLIFGLPGLMFLGLLYVVITVSNRANHRHPGAPIHGQTAQPSRPGNAQPGRRLDD